MPEDCTIEIQSFATVDDESLIQFKAQLSLIVYYSIFVSIIVYIILTVYYSIL